MSFQSRDMGGLSSRRMRYAVAASLVLHILLLWPEPLRPPAREARALLQATMRSPAPVSPPALPTPLPPAAPASARALPAPTTAPAVLPFEPSREVSVPQPTLSSTEPVARPAVAPLSPNPASAAGPPVPQAAAAAAGSLLATPGNSEVLDGLRGYRLAVASQARRFKRYPAEAMTARWSGSAEVRLEVGADGQPRPATVARSSGYESLDRAALVMIDAGAGRARLPDTLRGRSFTVLLPVVFNLDEE